LELAFEMHSRFCNSYPTPFERTQTMNVKPLIGLLMAVACFHPMSHAQKSFWDGPNAYLGQLRPSDTPQIFAPGLLADPGTIVMDRIGFSPDGKEIYYLQDDRWYSLTNAKLKAFKYDGHKWNGPTVLNEHFFAPTFSADGTALYFEVGNPKQIWMSHRTKNGWTAPALFLDEPYSMYGFMPTKSGTYYIGSDPDAEDKKNGITSSFSTMNVSPTGSTMKSLGVPLNEPGYNGDFYVAPDESYMIVSAKETKTGQCELYISFRKSNSTWSVPVSLGSKINDGLAHRWGQYVTPDGKYLFYSRGTSAKDCAIYWVRFDKLLQSLRPKQL
jgi:WD40-like Beta Propeller Repeat